MPSFVFNRTIGRKRRMKSRTVKLAQSGKPINKRGKKTKAWDSIRTRELKPQFAAMGITTCEAGFKGCMYDDGLGFAHTLKRRHIQTDADMRNCALLCNRCHDKLELQGEARMKQQIEKIIEQRVFRLNAAA